MMYKSYTKLCHNNSNKKEKGLMMKRRAFLGVCAIAGTSVLIASEQKPSRGVLSSEMYATIAAVQGHMFPEGSAIPSAKTFRATPFLAETIVHPTYDKEIRVFVVEGAEELQRRENQKFLTYGVKQKEKALRAYEETGYGSGWLDRIMLLSLEGLLSDPIYGGNFRESGWKSLQTRGGEPRPSTRYIAL